MSEQKKYDDFFNEIFSKEGNARKDEEHSLSPMTQKLQQKKEHKIVGKYVSWLEKWNDAAKALNVGATGDELCFKHTLVERGKHFTEPVAENYITALYEIYVSWSHATKTKYYFAKKTDSVETIMSDGKKYVTYFIDDPQENGNQIVLLHFNKAENHVLISSGMLIDGKVIISKMPTICEFQTINGSRSRDEADFELEKLSDEEKDEFLRGASIVSDYEIDVDSTIITIDTETYLPVPKEVYLENGEYRAKIKLHNALSYFSFQIRADESEEIFLSDFEIAKCYYYGMGDFPQDEIKAAEMFEQIGDADSMYMLAHIWLNDSFNDVDTLRDGIFYLEQAAQLGHIVAKTELVYYTMKLLCMLPADEQKGNIAKYCNQISDAVATELPGALFFAAYIFEKGLFVEENAEKAFFYYLRAAKAGNQAAQARISYSPVGCHTNDDDCHDYFEQSKNQPGLPEYCMGWFLADDSDVMVATDDILYFYKLAANSGVTAAIQELGEVYMSGNSYVNEDPAKAIMWYEKLTDIDDDVAIKLANYYIDGKGCVRNNESDIKALRLLCNVVEKSENGAAYNNLGWMYKMGRGCDAPDYAKAVDCFRRAAELECKSAFYHLGDIYEHGLGVDIDFKLAWDFYQKGAELGHEKCIEKVNYGVPTDFQQSHHNRTVSLLTDIQEQVSEINTSTARMEHKLDRVLDFIENDLNSVIATAKKKVKETTGDEEPVIADFIETTSAYINNAMVSPDALIEQETKQLQLLFGKSWERLLPTSKTSLVSAGVLWKSCASITKDNFDFSGVCISATSALEAELKRVFYTGFQIFLESRYGKPDANDWEATFANWPEKLLSCTRFEFKKALDKYFKGEQKWKPTLEKGNTFTMGVLPFIFGKHEKFRNPVQEKLLHQRLAEYLSTIVVAAYADKPIEAFYIPNSRESFVEKSERVRKDYRNKAAHVDVVSRDQAEGCYQQVIGKIDAYEYTFGITGLIIELYDKLG